MIANTRRIPILSLACGISAVLCTSLSKAALIPAIDYGGGLATSEIRSNGPYTIGEEFHVGSSNLSVTALGVQDINASAVTGTGLFAPPISVGLWTTDATPVLLASTTVDNSAAVQAGGYRYTNITPVTLTQGTNYLIGAYVGGGIAFFGDGQGTPSITPYTSDAVTLLNAQYLTGSFGAPTAVGTAGGPSERWGAANFLSTPAPEPGSLGMAAIGTLVAGLAGRRSTSSRLRRRGRVD